MLVTKLIREIMFQHCRFSVALDHYCISAALYTALLPYRIRGMMFIFSVLCFFFSSSNAITSSSSVAVRREMRNLHSERKGEIDEEPRKNEVGVSKNKLYWHNITLHYRLRMQENNTVFGFCDLIYFYYCY